MRPSATFFSLNPFHPLQRRIPLVARFGLCLILPIISNTPSKPARLGFGEKKVSEGLTNKVKWFVPLT